jgi:hypothetical protein
VRSRFAANDLERLTKPDCPEVEENIDRMNRIDMMERENSSAVAALFSVNHVNPVQLFQFCETLLTGIVEVCRDPE